jgi:hypothetical protein
MEMNKTMTKKVKGLMVNVVIVATLVFFYVNGTPPLGLLITGIILLAVFNVVLILSKPRS